MRSLLLFAVVLALVPVAFSLPAAGVLVWSWLSFMNPHREVYGAAYDFPFNLAIAAVTLLGWTVSRESKAGLLNQTTLVMLLFVAWTSVTTITAIDPTWSQDYWLRNLKTFVLVVAVMGLINTKVRFQAMIWIIALSLGFYAVRGTGFLILTGGQYRIFGPEQSMIEDNNSLALALLITLPLLNYLRKTSRHFIVSSGIGLTMLISIVAIVGTYSRGGLVGLVIVTIGMWLQSRHKVLAIALLVGMFSVLPFLVPQQWYERMATIQGYGSDESFGARLEAWNVSLNVALKRPLVGGGFSATQLDKVFIENNTQGAIQQGTAAHSVYFQVLGDHGFVGLGLYAAILVVGWLNVRSVLALTRDKSVSALTRDKKELEWAFQLASAIRISFVAFLTAGSLLSMAYYDMFLVLLAMTATLRALVENVVRQSSQETAPSWRRVDEVSPARTTV